MIHDIAPKQYDNRFNSRRAPRMTDLLLICRDRKLLVRGEALEQQRLQYPTVEELPCFARSGTARSGTEAERAKIEGSDKAAAPWQAPAELAPGIWEFRGHRLIWLFAVDDTAFYGMDEGELTIPSYSYASDNIFRTAAPRELAFAGITALQLYRWRQDHRFCGRCGGRMRPSRTERAFVCPDCQAVVYPKICPAVIVAVLDRDRDRILVSRYAGRGKTRSYALIAGFAEIGEPIEDTVHREVLEEVGVRVKNLRFYKSQPWSFSDTLLMGFICELDGDDTIRLDENELAMAAWLSREELPERAGEISLTAEMMENFRVGRL